MGGCDPFYLCRALSDCLYCLDNQLLAQGESFLRLQQDPHQKGPEDGHPLGAAQPDLSDPRDEYSLCEVLGSVLLVLLGYRYPRKPHVCRLLFESPESQSFDICRLPKVDL